MSILGPFARAATSVLGTTTSQTWVPLVALCKNGIISKFQDIKNGKLVLTDGSADKVPQVFGTNEEEQLVAYLHVDNEKFWVRVGMLADMVRVDDWLFPRLTFLVGVRRELYARGSLIARSDQVFRGSYRPRIAMPVAHQYSCSY
jgi:cyclopropane-fatty-acyl-phospholipid synthase